VTTRTAAGASVELDVQARTLRSRADKLRREKRAFNEESAKLRDRERVLNDPRGVFKEALNERLDDVCAGAARISTR
jgi:hypothetical protein